MPEVRHGDQTVSAVRYEPGHAGHIIHRLSDYGVPSIHLQPTTQAISICDPQAIIDIQDPRHNFEGNEGVIHPGDWIVWRHGLKLKVVPSRIFGEEYTTAE